MNRLPQIRTYDYKSITKQNKVPAKKNGSLKKIGSLPIIFEEAQNMHFNTVQLQPFIQHRGGNPEAIMDHYAISESMTDHISTMTQNDQIKWAVKQAHLNGILLFMELPMKYVSTNHPFAMDGEHDNWFLQNDDGTFMHPVRPIKSGAIRNDVIMLDYKNEKVRDFMIKVMEHWAAFGFDGIKIENPIVSEERNSIPDTFWKTAISRVKDTHPSIIFLADTRVRVGNPQSIRNRVEDIINILGSGFDLYTNSLIWWNLHRDESAWTIDRLNHLSDLGRSVSFPTTHKTSPLTKDIRRPKYRNNFAAQKLHYALMAFLSHAVSMTSTYPTETDKDLTGYIKQVNMVKRKYAAFGEGKISLITKIANKGKDFIFIQKHNEKMTQTAYIIANRDVENDQEFRPGTF